MPPNEMMGLLRLVARIPLPLLHAFGIAMGWLFYALSPRFRRYHRGNLAKAKLNISSLRRAAVGETGKAVLELPAIWLLAHEKSAALVRDIVGWELIEKAMQDKRGLILLTPHLGCWEVSAQYFSRRYPLTVLYSAPKVKSLEALMRAGRDRANMKSVPADMSGVRALYRALQRGEAIGILPDQVPGGGEGEWVDFFGHPAYTMTLAMRMAHARHTPVLIAFARRLPHGRGYEIKVEAMPDEMPGESPARCMNRAIENLIRECPTQYLWAYNRYKTPAGVTPPVAL
ncbi:MAG: lysophospholipid acyltransferase family protein [Burkholderiales bacterium]